MSLSMSRRAPRAAACIARASSSAAAVGAPGAPSPHAAAGAGPAEFHHIIDPHLKEIYQPSDAARRYAHVRSTERYFREHNASIRDPEAWWGARAKSFAWRVPPTRTMRAEFNTPDIKWFEGGKLNVHRKGQEPGRMPFTLRGGGAELADDETHAAIFWRFRRGRLAAHATAAQRTTHRIVAHSIWRRERRTEAVIEPRFLKLNIIPT
jgi:hypothetical protein